MMAPGRACPFRARVRPDGLSDDAAQQMLCVLGLANLIDMTKLIYINSSTEPAVLRVNASASNSSGANTPPRTVPGMGEPTKKQRQNAARAAAAREAKEAAERERLATLAAHKKQLERERMTQQAKEKSRNGSNGTRTNRQTLSGGMQAKVSETGALIWD